MGSCTRTAVDCPLRAGVATGVSASVVSAVAVGEVAGICAGPGCSVSHAAAAMSSRVARKRFRIGDTSRASARPGSSRYRWSALLRVVAGCNSGQRRPRDLHCRFRWRWAYARRESPRCTRQRDILVLVCTSRRDNHTPQAPHMPSPASRAARRPRTLCETLPEPLCEYIPRLSERDCPTLSDDRSTSRSSAVGCPSPCCAEFS